MAYHLAQEARAGLSEFRIPPEFGQRLFDYQVAAVKIAAHHLNKRGGVLIGDVVGLGKTLMATALAKIFQDDHFTETLIICPKNLVKMWEDYVAEYRLLAKVLSITLAPRELPDLRRYRVVLIDESQNLRNREGKRYRAIQEYIHENESKCILLSATPYNKTYVDLSNQLRLFVPEDKELGIRPERLLRDIGETEFIRRHQCPVRSLAAFEKSEYADDWRELMRLYMVRRTGSFIQDNYAALDPANGRKFLTFEDGTRSYFPERVPKTIKFRIDERDPADQYAQFYAVEVVAAINGLNLPRYGLANYVVATYRTSHPLLPRQRCWQTYPALENGLWASAGRTCSNVWRAAGRHSNSRSNATFSATTSSFTPSRRACRCRLVPRIRVCSMLAATTRTLMTRMPARNCLTRMTMSNVNLRRAVTCA